MGNEFIFLLRDYFKEILSVAGAIGMFFLGKKKRKQDVKSQNVSIIGGELDNVEAALKIYRVMLDDLQAKLTEAQSAYVLLEQRFQVASGKNKEFKEKISMLEAENSYLSNKLTNCN